MEGVRRASLRMMEGKVTIAALMLYMFLTVLHLLKLIRQCLICGSHV